MMTYNFRADSRYEGYPYTFYRVLRNGTDWHDWLREHHVVVDGVTEDFGPPSLKDEAGRWTFGDGTIAFRDERDAMAFRLRWK